MRKADNLPPYCAVVKNSRTLNFLDPCGPAWPVMGVLYVFSCIIALDIRDAIAYFQRRNILSPADGMALTYFLTLSFI